MARAASVAASGAPRRAPRPIRHPGIDALAILNALPDPVLVVDHRMDIRYVNGVAQEFFEASAARMVGASLAEFLPAHCPVFMVIEKVLGGMHSLSQSGVALETPRIGLRFVDVHAVALNEAGQPTLVQVLVTMREQSIARKIDNQLSHRSAARSVTAMASMLAHEVKNPLSGIRGAAQLLDQTVPEDDRVLTRLICDEADRIVKLIDRMEIFSDKQPLDRGPVNIHQVLDRVRKVAETGFARHIRFVERYDPSLPPVFGNHDQLVQVFLNLVKNAAEAVPDQGGEVVLSTAYQQGVRLAVPGRDSRVHLPLLIGIQDNGDGISEDMRPHLFDPFVTTKRNGTGLGLALVAKIVDAHGGVIDFESAPRRTVFTVSLPMDADRGTSDGTVWEQS